MQKPGPKCPSLRFKRKRQLVAGPLVGWIVGALEGAVVVGGLSATGAGLVSLGIPKDSIMKFEKALKYDKFVVMAHGTAEEATRAREILNHTNPEALEEHPLSRPNAEPFDEYQLSPSSTEVSLVGGRTSVGQHGWRCA